MKRTASMALTALAILGLLAALAFWRLGQEEKAASGSSGLFP